MPEASQAQRGRPAAGAIPPEFLEAMTADVPKGAKLLGVLAVWEDDEAVYYRGRHDGVFVSHALSWAIWEAAHAR